MELMPAMQPATPPSSAAPAASNAIAANPMPSGHRPVNGGYNFYPRAAGIGNEQIDKLGFDKVGPSSQGWAHTAKQRDGSWLTTINVPYGVHLGGTARPNGNTDRYTTMEFRSKQQPTLNSDGRLFISGREVTGDLLEARLAKLGLDIPNFKNFTAGGNVPE